MESKDPRRLIRCQHRRKSNASDPSTPLRFAQEDETGCGRPLNTPSAFSTAILDARHADGGCYDPHAETDAVADPCDATGGAARPNDAPTLLLCGMFASATFMSVTPFLNEMSRDLGISTGVAGRLASASSLAAALSALLLVPFIAGWSWKRVLLLAVAVVGVASVLTGLVAWFPALLAFQFMIGAASATTTTTALIAVGRAYPDADIRVKRQGLLIGSSHWFAVRHACVALDCDVVGLAGGAGRLWTVRVARRCAGGRCVAGLSDSSGSRTRRSASACTAPWRRHGVR